MNCIMKRSIYMNTAKCKSCLEKTICLVVLLFTALDYGCSKESKMLLPYNKVNNFNDDVCLLTSFMAKAVIIHDIGSKNNPWKEVVESHSLAFRQKGITQQAIASCPDGSRYYICTCDKVGICKADRVIETIPIEAFNLDGKEYRFCWKAYASNDRLWLYTIKMNDPNIFLVIEWNIESPPSSKKITTFSGDWEDSYIDSNTGRLFIADDADEIRKQYHYDFIHGIFFDFNDAYGLLLSSSVADNICDNIFFRKSGKSPYEIMTWGGQAQWGSDGYIYFLRGSTQLWRKKLSESDPELVFRSTDSVIEYRNYYGHELKIDASRRYLAFSYNIDSDGTGYPMNYYNGLLLIDLARKEYIHFTPSKLRDKYLDMLYNGRLNINIVGDIDIRHRLSEKQPISLIGNMGWLME